MSNENKCQNPSCGKKLKQLKGKRAKKYCNSTCRSSHFQKRQRAGKEKISSVDSFEKEQIKIARKNFRVNLTNAVMAGSPTTLKDLNKQTSTVEIKPNSQTNYSIDSRPKDVAFFLPKELDDKVEKVIADVIARPKNLKDLKALVPSNLTGLERSSWIATERRKFGI